MKGRDMKARLKREECRFSFVAREYFVPSKVSVNLTAEVSGRYPLEMEENLCRNLGSRKD